MAAIVLQTYVNLSLPNGNWAAGEKFWNQTKYTSVWPLQVPQHVTFCNCILNRPVMLIGVYCIPDSAHSSQNILKFHNNLNGQHSMAENCVNKKMRMLLVAAAALTSLLLSVQNIFFLFKYVNYNFPFHPFMYTLVPPFSFYRFSFSLFFAMAAFVVRQHQIHRVSA